MERPEIAGKWKKLKKDQIVIGILVGVLLLVIALPQGGGGEEETGVIQESQLQETLVSEDPTALMEEKLQKILEQVEGVGKVQVMITVKSSGKKTVEKDSSISEESSTASGEGGNSQVNRTEETTVYARDSEGNETPFIIEETAPEIAGVLVAAQGGDNLTVAEDISEAAMVLFGVDLHKIKIMKLN